MNDGKDLLRMLLSFLLIFVFLGLQVMLFTDKVVFNPKTYKPYYTEEDYFNRMAAETSNKLEIVARYNNVPLEVLSAPIDEAFLKAYAEQSSKNFIAYLRGESRNYEPVFDETALKSSVENYVTQHLAASGLPYDDNAAAQVNSIVESAVDAVNNTVMILNPDLLAEFGVAGRINRLFNMLGGLELALSAAAFVIIILLLLLNWKHFMRTAWWVGSSLAISSLVLLIIGIFLIAVNLPGRLGAADTYIRWMAETGIAGILRTFCIWQVVGLLLAGVLMGAYVIYRRRKVMLAKAKKLKHQLEREDPQTNKIGPVSLAEVDGSDTLSLDQIEALMQARAAEKSAEPAAKPAPDTSCYDVDIRQKYSFTSSEIKDLIYRNRRKEVVFIAEDYTITFPKETLCMPKDQNEVSMKLDYRIRSGNVPGPDGKMEKAMFVQIEGAEKLPGPGIIDLRLSSRQIT